MATVRGGPAAGAGGPGSQKALREQNTATVLAALQRSGPQVQAALARATGLSNATVSNIVRDLIATGRVHTERVLSSGRWAAQVSLAPDSRVVIGIDIGRTHLRMLGSDTTHHTFGPRTRVLEAGHKPPQTLALAAAMLDEFLVEHAIDRSRLQMCGIALPASLAPMTGAVVQESVLPNWAGHNLAELSGEALGLATVIDNDANLGALAHVSLGEHRHVRTLLYLKLATGIGAGLTFRGQVYRSTSGLVGEIGHFQVVDGGEVCYCGNRGCLETVSSTRRVVADYAHIRPGREVTLDDVVAASRAGDPAVRRILEEAGTALGRVVAMVCNLLSPDVVVLGGPLASVGQPLLDSMVVSVRQRALPGATASTIFELSRLDEEAEVRGACLLALRHLLTGS